MSVQGTGFKTVVSVRKAQQIALDNMIFNPTIEEIQIEKSLDRKIAENIMSEINIPGFRRSAMDGYAVVAEDTFGASETSPVTLEVSNSVEIGDIGTINHRKGTATRISTGAPIPIGANAVVKLEDTEKIGDKLIDVVSSVNVGTNVSKENEDVKSGDLVFSINHLIKPWDIAMLASLELTSIKVYSKPKISVLSTGKELVPIGSKTTIGQVVDSNRPAIVSWLSKYQVEIVHSLQCDDDEEILSKTIQQLAEDSDLVITTGGTSVGTKDYLPQVISKIGEIWVHGIAIRPGKPLGLGSINTEKRKVPIIALPGYPLAAFINFELFAEHIISNWTGNEIPWRKTTKVKLKQKVPSSEGLIDFVRLKHTPEGAEIIRITGAGILSSLVSADYLLQVPEHIEGFHEGEIVEVRIIRGDIVG